MILSAAALAQQPLMCKNIPIPSELGLSCFRILSRPFDIILHRSEKNNYFFMVISQKFWYNQKQTEDEGRNALYTALYRKLRPRRFADIVGQEPIVRTLRNQVRAQKTSHAYLFCGTRGTGKTTTALVLAKAINCENPNEGEPCDTCEICAIVNKGTGFNVIEMDAASNNSVDNIRDIIEEIKYPPAMGRYKIYIIDEAHMLSSGAFNALLKTLEEPPDNVIFILATTEAQKIPATIHSRCQRFDFKRLASEVMAQALLGYLAEENIACAPEAARYAALLADGSMRDMLSIIDQCAAFYMDEEITLEKIVDITGGAGTDRLISLFAAISEKNTIEALKIVDDLLRNGRDVKQILSEILSFLRDSLIALTAGAGSGLEAARILDMSVENVDKLRQGVKNLTPLQITGYITLFSDVVSKTRYAGNPRILFEVAMVNLTVPSGNPESAADPQLQPTPATPQTAIPVDINTEDVSIIMDNIQSQLKRSRT